MVHPALLTRMSSRPNRSIGARNQVVALCLVADVGLHVQRLGRQRIGHRLPASTDDDELTTTFAPRLGRRRAVASPMPLDEPVTIATLPSSPSIVIILRLRSPEPTRDGELPL